MTSSDLWSDGNALAGPLQDVVRVDITAAVGRCTGCGRTAAMAEVRVFDHAPGVVACPTRSWRAAGTRSRPCLAGPARPDLPAGSPTGRDLSHPG